MRKEVETQPINLEGKMELVNHNLVTVTIYHGLEASFQKVCVTHKEKK